MKVIRKGININQRDVSTALEMVKSGTIEYFAELYDEEISRNMKGKAIRAKTIGQREYVSAIRSRDLVFCIGPAGTGKTYLAVVLAVLAMKTGSAKRIVLTRPAVEAGESLGFLPGDLKEKVDPYFVRCTTRYTMSWERNKRSTYGTGSYRNCTAGLYEGTDTR